MNELLHFFAQGLIIMFFLVLGLFLLVRMKRILAWLFAFWMIMAILAFFALPLITIVWAIFYLAK